MKTSDFQTKSLARLAAKFIIPSVLGMIFMSLQTIIDGFFIGKFLGEDALASLTIVSPLISMLMAISMVIGIGSQSLISIKIGAGDTKKAQDIFRTAVISAVVVGGLLAIFGASFARPIAKLLGASPILIDNSAAYLRIIAISAPFVALFIVTDFGIRLLGKPQISMVAMFISAAINIVLDYVFLKYTSLGMTGAALATALAYSTAGIVTATQFFRKKYAINFYSGKFCFHSLGRIVYNGGSEGINSLAAAVTVLVFNLQLMRMAGEAGVASYTAIMYIMNIGFSVLMGISDGMRPIVSYNYGACNTARLKKSLRLLGSLGFITGLLTAIVIAFGARPLARIFVESEAVVEMTVSGARIVALAFLFSNFNIMASGFYTSINFAKESILISLMRGCVFMIIGVMVLPLLLGVSGVWGTFLFADGLTFIVVAIMFIIQYKKKIFFPTKKIALDEDDRLSLPPEDSSAEPIITANIDGDANL